MGQDSGRDTRYNKRVQRSIRDVQGGSLVALVTLDRG